jgi:hypothetical protein
MVSEVEWRALNARGLLPLSREDERSFLDRIAVLEKEKTSSGLLAPEGMEDAFRRCEQLFDATPDWVSIIEQQRGLAPWQGAVLWIQEDEKGNIVPLIQVSPRLRTSWLRKWYTREEVVAHELVHAMRLPLNSPRFEEITAYQTSPNLFRRSLGPLIRYPYEVYILLGAVVLGWLGLVWSAVSFFLWIPWIACLLGAGRLFLAQLIFKRAQAKVKGLLKDKAKALALMARLTDGEVAFFAKASVQEIKSYVEKAKKNHLRWQMLFSVYF